MARAKSALDRLKEMPAKEITKKLPCPQHFGLSGVYTLSGKCQFGEDGPPDYEYCERCWTSKF